MGGLFSSTVVCRGKVWRMCWTLAAKTSMWTEDGWWIVGDYWTYQEYVVPKSIPMTVPMSLSFSFFSSASVRLTQRATTASIRSNFMLETKKRDRPRKCWVSYRFIRAHRPRTVSRIFRPSPHEKRGGEQCAREGDSNTGLTQNEPLRSLTQFVGTDVVLD